MRRAAPQSGGSGILQGKICEAGRRTTENGTGVAKNRLGGELDRDDVPAVPRQVAATRPRGPRTALRRAEAPGRCPQGFSQSIQHRLTDLAGRGANLAVEATTTAGASP